MVPSGLDRQPDALVFRNQQLGRSACLHVGTRPLCRRASPRTRRRRPVCCAASTCRRPRRTSCRGRRCRRTVTRWNACWTVPGAITAAASSRAVTAPEGRPGAAVDRDLGTGWVAGPADLRPALTLKLPGVRNGDGAAVPQRPVPGGVPGDEVSVRLDGGPSVDVQGRSGRLRDVPRRDHGAERSGWPSPATTESVDVDSASGFARHLPVGVAEVRVLGADELRKAVDLNGDDRRAVRLRSVGPHRRRGPAARRLTGDRRDVLQRRPVDFTLCKQRTGPAAGRPAHGRCHGQRGLRAGRGRS